MAVEHTCRFAPSPSGRMHAGNVLSLLLAWLSARSQGARFVLRLEDLDERCRDAQVKELLLDDIRWLGLGWDGDPIVQSELDSKRYEDALEALEARGLLYPCFCSRADLHAASAPHASDGTYVYAGTCRGLGADEVEQKSRDLEKRTGHGPATRIRVPDRSIAFDDAVYGRCVQNLASDCGDFVVRRGDATMAYQLAVVVDDAASGVTEVVRGADLLSSTPRQMYLQELLGLPTPCYAHHPLLLAPDGRRLSKRDRDCDLGSIRSRQTRPEQLIGTLAHLVGLIDDDEPASARELVEVFSWNKLKREDIKLSPCFAFV